MAAIEITDAQAKVLRRVDDLEVLREDTDGKGYRFDDDEGRAPNEATVTKLLELGLIRPKETTYEITDEGKVALNGHTDA